MYVCMYVCVCVYVCGCVDVGEGAHPLNYCLFIQPKTLSHKGNVLPQLNQNKNVWECMVEA